MKGHHIRFRENGDLPQWQGSAAKKKPPFFIAGVLMTLEIIAVGMRLAILGNHLNLSQSFFATYSSLQPLPASRTHGKPQNSRTKILIGTLNPQDINKTFSLN